MEQESSFNHGETPLIDRQMDENEFAVIENPYYGDAGDIALRPTRKSPNIVDLDDVQHLTATENAYYEMWSFWLYKCTMFVKGSIFDDK